MFNLLKSIDIDKHRLTAVTAILFVALAIACTPGTSSPVPDNRTTILEETTAVMTPLLASPAALPRVAALTDGKSYVLYELAISNGVSFPVTIEKVEVMDIERPGKSLAVLDRTQLISVMHIPGKAQPSSTLSPGDSGYLKINLVFNGTDSIPGFLEHVITVSNEPLPPVIPATTIQHVARLPIDMTPPMVIGPPLRGERWVAGVVGPAGFHRNTIMPINGRWTAPERWAVDWIQLDAENRIVSGARGANSSYPQYGKEVFAVSDGVILQISDGMDDTPPEKPLPLTTLDAAAGNYISQDIGNGCGVLYAHLIKGSLRVRAGETVKKGQLIGLLGSSGNSDGPHLHFHVFKGRNPMAGDGVPYVIDSFELAGEVLSTDNMETEAKNPDRPVTVRWKQPPEIRHNAMPGNIAIINFR